MTQTDETKDILRKLAPVIPEATRGLWYDYLLSKDARVARKAREQLRLLADKMAKSTYEKSIRLPPPATDKLVGEYEIGTVLYPDKEYSSIGLNPQDLLKHTLIVGSTGTGKTNLVFGILRKLAQAGKPFLILDWKRSYRRLKNLPEFKSLQVIRLGEANCKFRFNPLIPPPNVNPKHWLALLIDVIRHAFFVAEGVEYLTRKAIDYLYTQYGIYEGKTQYPTFEDVEKVLKKEYVRGREMLWMGSAKRVLSSLTFSGLLGEVLNVRTHEPVENLLNGQYIIELDNLASLEKVFFIEALLLYLYQYKKNNTEKRNTHYHTIVIEEAHHILSAKKEYSVGHETITETIIRMIREFGVGVIAVDQEPSKLSQSILANTNSKICFTLGSGKDIRTISEAMNLTPEERDCIDRLQVGHAVVKLKNRFIEPVHVRFPLVNLED